MDKLLQGEQKLREAGIELWLAGLNPVPRNTLKRSLLGEVLGEDRVFEDLIQAVEAYIQRFDEVS
jgi:hypothetical protein